MKLEPEPVHLNRLRPKVGTGNCTDRLRLCKLPNVLRKEHLLLCTNSFLVVIITKNWKQLYTYVFNHKKLLASVYKDLTSYIIHWISGLFDYRLATGYEIGRIIRPDFRCVCNLNYPGIILLGCTGEHPPRADGGAGSRLELSPPATPQRNPTTLYYIFYRNYQILNFFLESHS